MTKCYIQKQKWHLHNYAFKLGRVSNMNLVYGLALDEFSVAEVYKWIERHTSV